MLTMEKIRAWVAAEYKAATDAEHQAVQNVLDFIDGKHALEKAIETVEAAGYTVTPNTGKTADTAAPAEAADTAADDTNNIGSAAAYSL